jgi:hypothetical protein
MILKIKSSNFYSNEKEKGNDNIFLKEKWRTDCHEADAPQEPAYG